MPTHERITALKEYIAAQGWSWHAGKPVAYGEQIIVVSASQQAVVTFYPKRGRMVLGGPDSQIKTNLAAWIDAKPGTGRPTPAAALGDTGDAATPLAKTLFPLPHIGADESGKGDWFGPLVVAAVCVDEGAAARLRRMGVRDSKLLEPATLLRLAGQIERLVSPEQRSVLAIAPEEYNRRYAHYGNINILLAEVYAQAIAPVWQATQVDTIVCDQFSQRPERLEQAFATQGLPRPIQQHHAEAASIAVAAASILAGAAFAAALVDLGQIAGLKGPLPAGASDIRALHAAAWQILNRHGPSALERYARLNFKPVQALLEAYLGS